MYVPQQFTRLVSLLIVSLTVVLSGCYPSKSVSFHGQIIDDETGQPVADATVCLFSMFCTLSTAKTDHFTATTDANGKFEIPSIQVRKSTIPNSQTGIRLCAMKKGYDWTEINFNYNSSLRQSLEVRLEPDREIKLPQGWIQIEYGQLSSADEPIFRFAFKQDKLQLVGNDEAADFEFHYKFLPENDRRMRVFGSCGSISGRQQFLESVTASNGIGQVIYQRTTGHPPRLPDLSTVDLSESYSFDQPYDGPSSFAFVAQNEFLLKTHDGKFALLHFESSSIKWVYQPNGTIDIDRRRKGTGRHCEHCLFQND